MKNIENIRNWNIIKDTDPDTLVSTNEGIDSFFVDSNLNGDFTEVTYVHMKLINQNLANY